MTALTQSTGIAQLGFIKMGLVSNGWSMSAVPPKADISRRRYHVCFVPIADIGRLA